MCTRQIHDHPTSTCDRSSSHTGPSAAQRSRRLRSDRGTEGGEARTGDGDASAAPVETASDGTSPLPPARCCLVGVLVAAASAADADARGRFSALPALPSSAKPPAPTAASPAVAIVAASPSDAPEARRFRPAV